MTLAGKTFSAYHTLCEACDPLGRYTDANTFVKVHWAFLGVPEGILGPRPFQHRFMDADTQGWCYKAGSAGDKIKRPFTSGGEAVSKAVRLNGSGQPLACEGEILVSRITNPTAEPKDFIYESVAATTNPQAPTYLAVQNYSESGIVVARWNYLRKVKTADFSAIPLP